MEARLGLFTTQEERGQAPQGLLSSYGLEPAPSPGSPHSISQCPTTLKDASGPAIFFFASSASSLAAPDSPFGSLPPPH